MKSLTIVVVLGIILGLAHAHTYHLGECPTVEPQADFNMKQFLGLWYVIQKTSTSSKCLIYNITQVPDEPSVYRIEQTNPIPGVGKPYHYTGQLTVPYPSVPAKMTANFPLSVAGTADYTVFLTDYTTYAGIFTCQKLPLSHRHSATILSRTKSLDKIYIEKLKSILSTANVNPFDLSIIDQSGCPKDYDSGIYIHKDTFTAHNIAGAIRNGNPGAPQWLRSRLSNAGVNPYDLSLVSHTECGPEATAPEAGIHINPETFSSHNIGQAVKKVGESIGDGVESLSDGAKKLFHKIKGDGEGKDREELDVRVLGGNRQVTTEQYAEWLP
ncbi:hypothetical protein M8J75_007408 [Diaphorina citri]|nr:hypothetical protein M8J75_007408 [Diaphorina citri]KAI5725389.1 hypothetical protein M8J77_014750 [Diaphorina citri]